MVATPWVVDTGATYDVVPVGMAEKGTWQRRELKEHMAMDLDKSKFDVDVVSPRNHFLFTPLLASTAVGTLEFRAIQEPTRTIPNLAYQQATVSSIDLERKIVNCEDAFIQGHAFQLEYDALILATGSEKIIVK